MIICISFFILNLTYILFCNLIYFILIFKDNFKKLIIKYKSLILINDIPTNIGQIYKKG